LAKSRDFNELHKAVIIALAEACNFSPRAHPSEHVVACGVVKFRYLDVQYANLIPVLEARTMRLLKMSIQPLGY
jgi:hypothetical protein